MSLMLLMQKWVASRKNHPLTRRKSFYIEFRLFFVFIDSRIKSYCMKIKAFIRSMKFFSRNVVLYLYKSTI